MRASLALASALAFLFPLAALGNGGPEARGIPGTGDGTLLAKSPRTSVSIEEEDLTIDLHQEFAEVRLRYRMRNAAGAVEQAFFYPVESWEGDVERYAISVDGEALEEAIVDADGAPAKAAKQIVFGVEDNWSVAPPPIRRWRKSVIPFAAGQRREVLIRYRSTYAQNGVDISDHAHMEARFFSYRLSPAAAWKDPIGRGKVTVNVLLPEPENVAITRPATRFRQVSPNQWDWAFRDLRPTQADDLRITTGPPFYFSPGRSFEAKDGVIYAGHYRIVGPRAYFEHAEYEAKATSTLAPDKDGQSRDVANLRRRYAEEGTWAEGAEGDGIGESLMLAVQRPLPLAAVLIRPGYFHPKRKALWFLNNRVATCEISLNGEHTLRAEIPNEWFAEPYPIPVRGYNKPVRTVKLTILAVHRGTETRDTCISYLGLRARLAKVPKPYAVR